MQPSRSLFSQIISEHQGIIQSVCAVYYRNYDDRKDARQDILLQLWKSLPSFRNESKISTWIYRVSLNTVLARIRKEKTNILQRPRAEIHENHLSFCPFADDRQQQLRIIIDSLADTEKALIILYLEGYTHREISDILRLSETNVSTRMNRIKDKLRGIFKTLQNEHRSL